MTDLAVKKWLLLALVMGLSGVSNTALAEEGEAEESEEAQVETDDDDDEDAQITALLGDEGREARTEFEPTFGWGVETGVFFTGLARFNDYVLEPNNAETFDLWGTQHLDLAIESVVMENIRLSLVGGAAFAWHSDPSLFAWYVGLEPAFVAGDDEWELGVGVTAAVGSLGVTTGDGDRLSASLTMLRPFVEVRRHLSDSSALYVRGGFNQWYPRNPRSDELNLQAPTGNRPLSTVDISTGGVYLAVGMRFGRLQWQVEELEEEEVEPECTRSNVEETCTDIPETVCEDNTLRSYQAICSDGECDYQSTDMRCASGTECGEEDGEAACVPVPECEGDGDCEDVPAPICEDRVLTTFAGVCQDGSCEYVGTGQPCDEGYNCGLEGGVPACVEEPEEIVVEIDEEAGRVELREMVFFETGSAAIAGQSGPLLNQIARVLNENPQVEQVRIEGHTDNQGGEEFNRDLSQRRAESVREALIERGVAPDRLAAQGYGLTRPVADNRTEAGRAENRRVEMHIVESDEEVAQEEVAEEEEEE